MIALQWVGASLLAAFFLLLSTFNLWCWFLQAKRPDRGHVSVAPLLGGVAGALALLITPLGTLEERAVWIWIPLVADVGCVPVVLLAIVVLPVQWFRERRKSPGERNGVE